MHEIETLILAIPCDKTMQTSLPRAVLILDVIPTIYFIIMNIIVIVILIVDCINLNTTVLFLNLLLLNILLLVLYLLAKNSIL